MSRTPAHPLLQLDELVAGFSRPLVGPISARVTGGEIVGISGVNGSGKSTLLQAIAGAAPVLSGTIRRAPGLRLAYQVQQPPSLGCMPLTGWDLLASADALEPAPPVGLAPFLGRRVDQLSGGQLQLLRVWCALATPADLVLLDEPTNNLDPEGEALVGQCLATQPRHRAVLLVSHEQGFLAAACTRQIQVGAQSSPGPREA